MTKKKSKSAERVDYLYEKLQFIRHAQRRNQGLKLQDGDPYTPMEIYVLVHEFLDKDRSPAQIATILGRSHFDAPRRRFDSLIQGKDGLYEKFDSEAYGYYGENPKAREGHPFSGNEVRAIKCWIEHGKNKRPRLPFDKLCMVLQRLETSVLKKIERIEGKNRPRLI